MREQLRTTRLTNLSPEANRRAEKEQLGPVQYKPSAYPPQSFPIGTANQPWGDSERAAWLALHSVKRSYQEEVLDKLALLKDDFDMQQYGALSYDPERYPLICVQTRNWNPNKPSVLITGGVHGYETSGVQGALQFLATKALDYSSAFNIIVCPCVSPWGYECIQRWNNNAVDPNRSFQAGIEGCDESAAVMQLLTSLDIKPLIHLDLHETTDTDESEFRPAKCARDGLSFEGESIPDGFYLVSNSENLQAEWHKAMIDTVRGVTHIAPPDEKGICGEPITQDGVIAVPVKAIGTCSGLTDAVYATTTEVYPDSPLANDDICNQAQVACVVAALDHVLQYGLA